MLSCPALEAVEDRVPVSVSLVQTQCQKGVKPSNNLRILDTGQAARGWRKEGDWSVQQESEFRG